MRVYVVQADGVVYAVFSTLPKAQAYVKDTWVEQAQSRVRIYEEAVL